MIYFLRNLLALIGLLCVAAVVYLAMQLEPSMHLINGFEDKAAGYYLETMEKLLQTGSMAEATVWKVPVADGLSPDDVEEAMKSVANEHNIKNVGELPLYKEIEAMGGKPYRYVKIFMFCNAMTASRMIDYSDAFSAYLPCRVSLIEDKSGKLWIYSLNMDGMIYGGKPLPPALKAEAEGVKETILDIMKRGASGEF
jgi:uncharacterized protein (DUF302 family)